MPPTPPTLPAVVMAGRSSSKTDLLAAYTNGGPKALIPIHGRPMIAYVIDALAASHYINRVVVVGLEDLPGETFTTPIDFLPDSHGLIPNAQAGLRHAATLTPTPSAILFSGSDVPLVTGPIVDAFIEECLRTDHDLYYSVVERSVMEARFPGSSRSYVHLREGEFAGADISMVRPSVVVENQALWQALGEARKSPFKQARLIGLSTAILLLTRRLTLADAQRRVTKVLNLRGRVISFPHAEIGMDVDKPFQLEIVRSELAACRTGAA